MMEIPTSKDHSCYEMIMKMKSQIKKLTHLMKKTKEKEILIVVTETKADQIFIE